MNRLIVCCDGTWNREDQRFPTNVAKMAQAIAAQAGDVEQRVFYQRGVGTGGLLNRLVGAFGSGLAANVKDAYRFLSETYASGDELWLFGFSRGAYTARSVVGMVRKCGILRRENLGQLDAAYRLYKDGKIAPDSDTAHCFRLQNSQLRDAEPRDATPVHFMGVWDTVGALGIPVNIISRFTTRYYRFHDVALSRSVDNAYQALAIDEKRRDYRPTLWEQHPQARSQHLEQRWFAGDHRNIGGGSPDSIQSDRTLRWMIEKARACGLGLDDAWLTTEAISTEVGPLEESRNGIFLLRALYWRPIGQGVTPADATYLGGIANESVDASVVQRNVSNPDYKPRNLVSYYRDHPEALENS